MVPNFGVRSGAVYALSVLVYLSLSPSFENRGDESIATRVRVARFLSLEGVMRSRGVPHE